ncbi:uncharacterized protein E0L32_003424 [Thyridium curvatum]|uniref:Ketoreductase domain-containing protein n=1 Tax=Thyridium curvatum TaxID=1093900 RepID=A0A507B3N6_9PEZI|nr:uncharacterized protein E0L32_003424 [Thyridium curvatum]TPX16862.1 hypothetical protein E0L32_003424 [Thyridium curvatum]
MSNQNFANKVVALTGGASGIGEATALFLASRGAKLSLADLQQEGLDRVKAEIERRHPGAEVMVFPLDVRNYEQVEGWTAATVERFGRLDGAANLAGVIPRSIGVKTLAEQDFEEWDFVMGVNATGVMHCLKAQMNAIADGGSIVNASSIAGATGRAKNGSYTASKHAVTGLTRTAAKEIGHRGVRVNAIQPGRIETPMSRAARAIGETPAGEEKHEQAALKRIGTAEECAHLIAYLLSDESTYISGTNIPIDGGWNC